MGFSGSQGDPAFALLLTKLAAISEYRVLFALTFGDSAITEARVQQALAQFVRSIQSFDSRYDAGRAAVANDNAQFPNFTPAENAGKQIFLAPPNQGGAGCAGCHAPPEFDIDPNSRNNGVITKIGGGTDLTNTRSPSLRDLLGPAGQSNGPFMHDGSFPTLAGVIDHYNAIPGDNVNLDNRLRRPGGVQNLNLTQQQKNNLEAFLRTLTGTAVYTDPKWSDPFDAEGQLSLIVLPPAAITVEKREDGTAAVTCQAVAGLSYGFWASDDLVTWTRIATVAADVQGKCTQVVNLTTNRFYRYTYEPPVLASAAATASSEPQRRTVRRALTTSHRRRR
jgi:cytochrome c peroxidase